MISSSCQRGPLLVGVTGYRFGYPYQFCYRSFRIGRCQMSIALGHSNGAMSEYRRDVPLGNARLGEPRAAGMPEIMKMELR